LWKKLVSQPTRWSRKFAKPLKTLNTRFGCGTLRLLLSQTWKRSRCGLSEFHVSAPGQFAWFFQPRNPISIPEDDERRGAALAAPPRRRQRAWDVVDGLGDGH